MRSSKDESPQPGRLRYAGGWLDLQNRRKPLSSPADKELRKAGSVSWTIRVCYMECTVRNDLGRCLFRRLSQTIRIGTGAGKQRHIAGGEARVVVSGGRMSTGCDVEKADD